MSTILAHQSHSLGGPLSRASSVIIRTQKPTVTRSYAEQVDHSRSTGPQSGKESRPLFLAGLAAIALIPGYYIFHSNKPAASEQAAIKESRRKGNPSQEIRDPRDSEVKTIEQKKQRESS
ncbi:hypothetical protein PV10_07269 [Exophiala mesophila]|uniref:Uncharacterized protein n=1 Tax=Exophiala mesophila TaxID=212818 RepID=A0A0D1WLN8_EXOME|nr:uncharacterized protein PV10_07269 [Exophiala mesophila]KIV89910.1 hypothetical protein PV10_07269 [Exophiala mesophila]